MRLNCELYLITRNTTYLQKLLLAQMLLHLQLDLIQRRRCISLFEHVWICCGCRHCSWCCQQLHQLLLQPSPLTTTVLWQPLSNHPSVTFFFLISFVFVLYFPIQLMVLDICCWFFGFLFTSAIFVVFVFAGARARVCIYILFVLLPQ